MVERINLAGKSRAEWLALRDPLLTASDIAAAPLLNCHPFKSSLRLYHEKAKLIDLPPQPDNAAMKRGRRYESAAAYALAEERPDLQIEKASVFMRDAERRMGATPDYFVFGDLRGGGVLQIKTCDRTVFDHVYAEPNSAPMHVILQTLTEAILCDVAFGMIVAMVVDAYDDRLAICDVPRHPAAEKKIIDAARDFWEHVDQGREPDVNLGLDRDLLGLLYPREAAGKTIDLSHDNQLIADLHERADLKDQIRIAEKRCEQIEAGVQRKMLDAERITGLNEFRVTWKMTHYNEQPARPPRDLRVLRILDRRD